MPPVLTGDVVLDLETLGFEDGSDDTVTLRRGNSVAPLNAGTETIEVYINGNLYTVLDESAVTSLTINGTDDNDTFLIEETAEGLPELAGAVPSGSDNTLLTGSPKFEVNGGLGTDALEYTFIPGGLDYNTIYAAINDGASTGDDEGELLFTDTGGATNSHQIYFTGLEPITTSGLVGGTLTVRGDGTDNNIIVDRADLVGPGGGQATDTRVFISNAEFFDFAANTYTGLVLEGLGGSDTIEVRGFADGETDLAQLTLDGHTADAGILIGSPDDDAADTLQLRTNELPGNSGTGISTDIFGRGGDDTVEVGDSTVGLDQIVGAVNVEGQANDLTFVDYSVSAKGATSTSQLSDGDLLTILDDANTASSTYTVTGTTVARTGTGTITYSTIERLAVNTSDTAASDIDVNSVASGGFRATINAGDAADDIDITTTGTSAVLLVNAGGGADTVDLADTTETGKVFLRGDAGADTITVVQTGGIFSGVSVEIEGGTENDSITVNQFDGHLLRIDGDAGADVITLEGIADQGSGGADLFGGDGNDTFNIGDTTNGLDDILGEVCVFGEGSDTAPSTNYSIGAKGFSQSFSRSHGDQLNILDDANTSSSTYTITSTTVDRTGAGTITYDSTVERLNVNTSDTAASDIDVTSTAGINVTTINAGDDADDIDISTTGDISVLIVNAGGGADTIDVATTADTSLTFLRGDAGADSITVVDTGNTSANGLDIEGGTEDDTITINQFNGAFLRVDGDAGADVITLEGIAVTGAADLFGSEGNDTFNIGDTTNGLDDILGEVCVFGEGNDTAPSTNYSIGAKGFSQSFSRSHGDQLNVLDDANTSSSTYTITATTVDRTGAGTITYDDTVERLNVNTSDTAASDIDVTSTAGINVTTINAGVDADDIDISTTGDVSVLIVNAGGGADTIDVATTADTSLTFLRGDAGADSITVVDTGNTSANGLDIEGGTEDDTITINQFDGAFLRVDGDAGADVITLEGIADHGSGGADLFGGDGNDTFNIGDTTNGLDDILGEICVFGEDNDAMPESTHTITAKASTVTTTLADGDLLNILDGANTAASTYTIDDTSVSRTGTGTIMYETVERLAVETAAAAASDVDILTTAAAVVSTINAGDMADDIDITTTGEHVGPDRRRWRRR